jgi:predicted ATP-binding protein involved in virulence
MNQDRQQQLSKIIIKGFKSIKECELDLKNINVLVGANGAGKSNSHSFIDLKPFMMILFNCPSLSCIITAPPA